MGIILNDGRRLPMSQIESLHFGADTPKMHVLKLPAEALNETDAPLAAPLLLLVNPVSAPAC